MESPLSFLFVFEKEKSVKSRSSHDLQKKRDKINVRAGGDDDEMGACLAGAADAVHIHHKPARGSETLSPDDLDVIFVDCDDTICKPFKRAAGARAHAHTHTHKRTR